MRWFLVFLVILPLATPNLYSYSVLTHEAIIDSLWVESIQPLLRQRFPESTAEDLKGARAFAYGGSIVQDAGYYPFGSHFFTDLTHFVRSGDFVAAMLRDSKNLNEYAFALGSLAHYAADTNGHKLGINRAVPRLYPKLQRKYGNDVTYENDPAAHLKTEFAFDVLQVAKGRYASEAFHDFIGFEVSKPLLEAAFKDTYGLELKDVFGALDLAIGTYRKVVSGMIPKMTEVAWVIKKDEIEKSEPGLTRAKFLYNLSRPDYEKSWGKQYRRPGFGTRALALFIRIVPKVGPFRALSFRTPTPEAEKLFMESFNATIEQYRALLSAERARRTQPADVNLDLGELASAGKYKMADDAYAKLIDRLSKRGFGDIPRELRENILAFYRNDAVIVTPKLQRQLEMLKGTTAYSRP